MLGLYLFIIAFWLWFCLIIADEIPITVALLAPVLWPCYLINIFTELVINIEVNLYGN